MSTGRWITADVFDGLATLEDGSVDLIVTSPPFLALRSYLPADHPDKSKEIGSESTPAEFIDVMLRVTAELRRVLAPHGSIAIELGDTYAGSGGAGGDYGDQGLRNGQPKFDGSGRRDRPADVAAGILAPTKRPGPNERDNIAGWPLAKSRALIPQLYEIALAYDINPLTGSPSPAGQWRIRNVVTWCRPNPPVGCVDDQTEALTPDGWKKHEDLGDGDLIAAYDPASDSCRFLPAKFVRWERDEELVAIEKRKTSQRLTTDHRCLVRTRKRPEPHVVMAGDLTNSHQTLLAAGLEDVPGPEPVTVERAELLGWFIAEGTAKYRQARIVQSLTANPEKVDRIRALLDTDGADYTEGRYVRRRPETISGGDVLVTWTIKGVLAEWLNLHHKRLPAHYATTWPTRTLEALFAGLIGGDGHYRKAGGGVLFHQQDQSVADAVQIIAIRLGRRASVTWQPSLKLWQVTVGDPEHYETQRWTKVRKWDGEGIPRTPYSGVVWCPQVETTFWLARRDGRTFITGNSLGDKWRPATSDLIVACTSSKRYWDDLATRKPISEWTKRYADGFPVSERAANDPVERLGINPTAAGGLSQQGAPLLDYWEIPPGGFAGAHYATFPPELVVPCVKAMCPPKVCRVCGEPSRRIVEDVPKNVSHGNGVHGAVPGQPTRQTIRTTSEALTLGWTECGHGFGCRASTWKMVEVPVEQGRVRGGKWINLDKWELPIEPTETRIKIKRRRVVDDIGECADPSHWRPGLVLDPFAGSGTTLAVATGHGYDAIGIDLDERNLELARQRVGMFLEEARL